MVVMGSWYWGVLIQNDQISIYETVISPLENRKVVKGFRTHDFCVIGQKLKIAKISAKRKWVLRYYTIWLPFNVMVDK